MSTETPNDVRTTPTWEVHAIREHDAEYVNPLPRITHHSVNGFAVQGRRDMLHHYDQLLADNARLRELLQHFTVRPSFHQDCDDYTRGYGDALATVATQAAAALSKTVKP
jgi:hypothetical protein